MAVMPIREYKSRRKNKMNDFVYDIPTKVFFGRDQLEKLGPLLRSYGTKVLFVTGKGSIRRMGLYDAIVNEMEKNGLTWYELTGINPNPDVVFVREGAKICRENGVDIILAAGGGSVMDTGKWIAAAAKADHDAWDFFSEKKAPVLDALPVVTIPTAAATGSEMDCDGVISNAETKDKVSRADQKLYPVAAFENPEWTSTCSAFQTAAGSADILSHIMEVYFNINEDLEMLDSFMEGMMRNVIKYAPIALAEPGNYKARAELLYTSSWAINGSINGGKNQRWTCHSIEHQLSAYYDITHGLGLAIITPHWMRYCLNEERLPKYVQFAKNVFGIEGDDDMDIANKGIAATEEFFFETLGLDRTLSALGIGTEHFEEMAVKAVGPTGVLSGFRPLTPQDVVKLYEMSL